MFASIVVFASLTACASSHPVPGNVGLGDLVGSMVETVDICLVLRDLFPIELRREEREYEDTIAAMINLALASGGVNLTDLTVADVRSHLTVAGKNCRLLFANIKDPRKVVSGEVLLREDLVRNKRSAVATIAAGLLAEPMLESLVPTTGAPPSEEAFEESYGQPNQKVIVIIMNQPGDVIIPGHIL
jgi:hypothetical protein